MKAKRTVALLLAVVMLVGVLCATTVTASAATVPAKITVYFLDAYGTRCSAKTAYHLSTAPANVPMYQVTTYKAVPNAKLPKASFAGWRYSGKTYKASTSVIITVPAGTTNISFVATYRNA